MMLFHLFGEIGGGDGSLSTSVTIAVITALVAATGYVARQGVEIIAAWYRAHRANRAALIDLHSLLRAGQATFDTQRELAERLYQMLEFNHPGAVPNGEGLERAFTVLYPHFNDDEKELHTIIRAMTEHSMKPLNEELTHWLKRDRVFKVARREPSWIARRWRELKRMFWGEGVWKDLAEKLGTLEAHLALWHAKYQAWIPRNPNHALVYVADEQKHGISFPAGIDQIVEAALTGRSPGES